jgi:hypothetical protein
MKTPELSKLLDQFKKDAIFKFEEGRKIHGENFKEIKFHEEMYGEIIDLLMYLLMRQKYGRCPHCGRDYN